MKGQAKMIIELDRSQYCVTSSTDDQVHSVQMDVQTSDSLNFPFAKYGV